MKKSVSSVLPTKTIQQSKYFEKGQLLTVQGIHYEVMENATKSAVNGRFWDVVVMKAIDKAKVFVKPLNNNEECYIIEPVLC